MAALLPGIAQAGEVRGRVESFPDGDPLAGVPVRAMDPQGRTAVGESDSDGAFVIAEVEEGWVRVQAQGEGPWLPAWHPDTYSFCGADVFRVDDDAGAEGLVFTLPSGGALEGRVSDAAGLPVEGATVTARGLDFFSAELVRTASTDADGAYRVDGLDSISIDGVPRDGAYRLSVAQVGSPAWYWPGTWDVGASEPVAAARDEVRTVDLQFPGSASVAGSVAHPDGTPAVGAVVRATGAGPAQSVGVDADGGFEIGGLVGDGVRLSAVLPGFATVHWPASAVSPGATVELTSEELVEVGALTLFEADDLTVQLDGVGPVRLTLRTDQGVLTSRTATAPETVFFGDLPLGPVSVEASPASPDGPLPAALDAAVGGSVSLALPAGGTLEGIVRGRGGRDLSGAEVDAIDPQTGDVLATARTTEGVFALGPLPAEPVLLRASWTTFCPGDPAWVEVYAPEARRPEDATLWLPTPGATDDRVFDLPPDGDADGMDDVWEFAWHLDPHRADGAEDPDGDGADNLREYRSGTDPLDRSSTGCGRGGLAVLVLPLLRKRGQRR